MARRGRKTRSLADQFNHAICDNKRFGTSKRTDRLNGVKESRIYSGRRADGLKETSGQLAQFVRENYPEVRMVKDITPEMAAAWIASKENDWSPSTREEHISRLGKLADITAQTYHLKDYDLRGDLKLRKVELDERVRDRGMDLDDATRLAAFMETTRSGARYSVGIILRVGCRPEEVNSVSADRIDLAKREIFLTNCKNGKNRRVHYDPKDDEYFRRIKDDMGDSRTVCGGIKLKSQSTAVRRGMEAIGISEKYPNGALHAVRKCWAKAKYWELRGEGLTKKDAWRQVQVTLGHGTGHREHLYKTYVDW